MLILWRGLMEHTPMLCMMRSGLKNSSCVSLWWCVIVPQTESIELIRNSSNRGNGENYFLFCCHHSNKFCKTENKINENVFKLDSKNDKRIPPPPKKKYMCK